MRAVWVYSGAFCGDIWELLIPLNLQLRRTKGLLAVRDSSRKRVGMVMEECASQPRAVPGGSGTAVQPPALPTPAVGWQGSVWPGARVLRGAGGEQYWCAPHPCQNSG